MFHQFQLFKGIDPYEIGFNEYPRCYSSLKVEMTECLFLEDLKAADFEMLNFHEESLTYEHVYLMMKTLGKFHAISLAMKDKKPDDFQRIASKLCDEHHLKSYTESEINLYYEEMIKKLATCFEKNNNLWLIERFKKAMGRNYSVTANELVSGPLAEPYAVICHGDTWIANTMSQRDDHNKPVDIRLIDFHFTRYASPVTDLVSYLLCCSTKEFRDKYYDDFLKVYHESVTNFLIK